MCFFRFSLKNTYTNAKYDPPVPIAHRALYSSPGHAFKNSENPCMFLTYHKYEFKTHSCYCVLSTLVAQQLVKP